jgi:hypothetical protein
MCCAWICRSRSAGVPIRLIHANNAIISLILWQVLKRGEKDEIVTKKGAYVRDTDLVILLLERGWNQVIWKGKQFLLH